NLIDHALRARVRRAIQGSGRGVVYRRAALGRIRHMRRVGRRVRGSGRSSGAVVRYPGGVVGDDGAVAGVPVLRAVVGAIGPAVAEPASLDTVTGVVREFGP